MSNLQSLNQKNSQTLEVEKTSQTLRTDQNSQNIIKIHNKSKQIPSKEEYVKGLIEAYQEDSGTHPSDEEIKEWEYEWERKYGKKLEPKEFKESDLQTKSQESKGFTFTDKHIYRFDINRPQPKYLWAIQSLIPFKSSNILLGKEGNGKTFLTIDLAAHLAHGIPFMGLNVKKCAVFYILGEGGFGFDNRLKAWYQYNGHIDSKEGFIYVRNIPYQFDKDDSAKECKRMLNQIIKNHPDMEGYAIFIDTLNRNLSCEADENSNRGMGNFVNNIINNLSCMDKVFCFALHHKNKEGRIRGHSSLAGNADNIWECSYDPGNMEVNLSVIKAKESETGQNYLFRANKVVLDESDEYDNHIETLVLDFDKKLEGKVNNSDSDKPLSDQDKAYYDVLVHLANIGAQARKIENITSIGVKVETWNNSAKIKGLFANQKNDFRKTAYNSRLRLEKKGYIKISDKMVNLTNYK